MRIFASCLGMKEKNKTKGISIIETVIYMAILAGILVFAANSIILISSIYHKSKISRRVASDAEVGLERIIRETRLAYGVDALSSVFDSDSSVVELESFVSATDLTPISKKLYLNGGRIYLQEGLGSPLALTSSKVTVNKFSASYIFSPNSEALKYEIFLRSGEGKASSSAEFFSTAILRGSY